MEMASFTEGASWPSSCAMRRLGSPMGDILLVPWVGVTNSWHSSCAMSRGHHCRILLLVQFDSFWKSHFAKQIWKNPFTKQTQGLYARLKACATRKRMQGLLTCCLQGLLTCCTIICKGWCRLMYAWQYVWSRWWMVTIITRWYMTIDNDMRLLCSTIQYMYNYMDVQWWSAISHTSRIWDTARQCTHYVRGLVVFASLLLSNSYKHKQNNNTETTNSFLHNLHVHALDT